MKKTILPKFQSPHKYLNVYCNMQTTNMFDATSLGNRCKRREYVTSFGRERGVEKVQFVTFINLTLIFQLFRNGVQARLNYRFFSTVLLECFYIRLADITLFIDPYHPIWSYVFRDILHFMSISMSCMFKIWGSVLLCLQSAKGGCFVIWDDLICLSLNIALWLTRRWGLIDGTCPNLLTGDRVLNLVPSNC